MTFESKQLFDLVNAGFEFGASLAIANHALHLYRDKKVAGFSPWSIVFFTAWGYFNIFFYPAVGATLSFYAGALVALVNSVYLAMLYYYIKVFPRL